MSPAGSSPAGSWTARATVISPLDVVRDATGEDLPSPGSPTTSRPGRERSTSPTAAAAAKAS